MSITIHCPFHNQHNLNNFPLDSLLPKPPNSTVHFLLFPSPKCHCLLPSLSLSPNLTTHPTTPPPPRHNLTNCRPLPYLHQFHPQLTNLFQISIIQLSTPKTLPFPIIPLSTPSPLPPIVPLSTPSPLPPIIPLSTLYLSIPSSHCPLSVPPSLPST